MLAGEVQLDANNANEHDARSIEAIARSLLRFGFRKPIVADADKVVRAGNGTLEACLWIAEKAQEDSDDGRYVRERGQAIGVLRQGKKANSFDVWIRCEVSPLRADEAMAYALADNQTARISSFDWQKVAEQLKQLQAADLPIADLGFAAFELEPLLAEEWKKPDIEELPLKSSPTTTQLLRVEFTELQYEVVAKCVELYLSAQEEAVSTAQVIVEICNEWRQRR